MSIFRIGWRCSIVEKASNGNRLPFFWHVGIPNRFCLHQDKVLVYSLTREFQAPVYLKLMMKRSTGSSGQTFLFSTNGEHTLLIGRCADVKIQMQREVCIWDPQGKDFYSFNNISSKLCNIFPVVKVLSFQVEVLKCKS